jgi:FSR family fosmidomycin resistance protein-like MFS transporter
MGEARLINRGLLMLMAGHFTVDHFSGLLPVMIPLLREKFALDLAATGLIVTIVTASLSLSQPFFGLFVDRFGTRTLGWIAVAWMGGFFTLIGLAPSYPLVLVAGVLAGLGSGAFHPLGVVNVPVVSNARRANTALSLHTIGGTGGYALGPLVGAALFSAFGLRGPLLLLPLAIGVSLWLARGLGPIEERRRARTARIAAGEVRATRLRPLLAVLGVVMLRSWCYMVLVNFLPILYLSLGYGASFYSPLLFVVLISGSIGTVFGGLFADRFNRRLAIVGSLVLLAPAIWLLLAFPGPGAFCFGVLVGLVADFSLPSIMTLAQELMPSRAGMASGLILGVGFVMGGVGVSITGVIADRIGLTRALMLLPGLLAVALVLTLLVPSDDAARRERAGEVETAGMERRLAELEV